MPASFFENYSTRNDEYVLSARSFHGDRPSAGAAQHRFGPMITQLMFLGLMFAAMYFLLIAPQRKKQKRRKMLAR